MQWFFAFSGNAARWYDEMIRVAVLSARENTSLEAHCIYDAEPSDLTAWLTEHGVRMHPARVPFRDELFSEAVLKAHAGTGYRPDNATGHYLRLLVPQFATDEQVLYTDCDVMFLCDPELPACATISAVCELDNRGLPRRDTFNSGVMGINVRAFAAEQEAFIEHCRQRNFFNPDPLSYDQVFLNQYFAGRWERLPAEMNWRPWQGVARLPPPVVHFHGPKPHRLQKILAGQVPPGELALKHYVELGKDGYPRYVSDFNELLNRHARSASR